MIAAACSARRRSRPLLAWLARGAAGAALIAAALVTSEPFIAILAAAAALLAFGGCPMCWTFGMIERVSNWRKGRASP